ncbi:hypothetical protein MOQ_005828 [Trypanosoma cruzi marinkellei]|uniref:Uncharacterized protein n=1 Tax=Trypanosoma cruzi marinkellei TaxID=85056 RepID=K2MX60_TRYCR|nr:hypothetical protein MOQ_005828 [Trypanosoma cruzi marinkellei]
MHNFFLILPVFSSFLLLLLLLLFISVGLSTYKRSMRRTWIKLVIKTANNGHAAVAVAAGATRPATVMLPVQSQRCIREIMVRQVLLSSKPLTSHELVDLVKRNYHEAKETVQTTSMSSQEGKCRKATEKPVVTNVGNDDVKRAGEAVTDSPVEYLRGFLMSVSTGPANVLPTQDRIPPCPVESTVRLILAIDSQFRVSPAGYVCYPNLPSLILASTDVEQKETWLHMGRRLVRAEEARHYVSGSDHGAMAATGGNSRVPSRWSYMLSLWFMLDAFTETEDVVEGKNVATGGNGTHDDVTISMRLMTEWVDAFDERELPPLLLREVLTAEGRRISRSPSVSAPQELRDSMEGKDILRRWCSEAREGFLSGMLVNAPQLTQSQPTLLQQVNEQLGYFFTFIIGAPISLGRLAALIQWASLPFASQYRSLLHFLLIYTGNPAVAQMERHGKRRREVLKRWTDLLRSRLQEDRSRHRHPRQTGGRHSLSGRYASQEHMEETADVDTLPASSEGNDARDISHGKASWAGQISSEQYALWMQSSSGPLVNPKLVDVCRCLFLTPAEMTPFDVATLTPSEVLDSFTANKGAENDVVVFSVLPYVFERRICRVIRVWWALEGQYMTEVKPSDAVAVISVQRLCQLCLWEHEYGAAAASRMMLHYLRSVITGETTVQLMPPPSSVSNIMTPTSVKDAGCWLVVLRSTA